MKVIYENKFLKYIKNLDSNISNNLKKLLLNLEVSNSLNWVKNMRKMIWYNDYYKIRIWDYRLWIKFNNWLCIF